VQNERQGVSTFQKVRTKTPSAQVHNKCKNATGLRPFKDSEPKRADKVQSEGQQDASEKSKNGCQKGGGDVFFPQEPSAPIIRFTQNKKN